MNNNNNNIHPGKNVKLPRSLQEVYARSNI